MPKPKNNPQNSTEQAKLLKQVPASAWGVYVRGPDGKKGYKPPVDVVFDDEILLKDSGEPIYMMKKPGRPRKVVLEAVSDEIAEVMEAREGFYSDSLLVKSTRQDPEGDPVFDAIMMALADEAAALEFERKEAERKGQSTEDISSKRSRVLKSMSDAWLKRRDKNSEGSIDFDSKAWEVVLTFTMETVRDTLLESGVRPEQVETVFTRLGSTMDDNWYQVAKSKMKEK